MGITIISTGAQGLGAQAGGQTGVVSTTQTGGQHATGAGSQQFGAGLQTGFGLQPSRLNKPPAYDGLTTRNEEMAATRATRKVNIILRVMSLIVPPTRVCRADSEKVTSALIVYINSGHGDSQAKRIGNANQQR
jgi:hypothetical protein